MADKKTRFIGKSGVFPLLIMCLCCIALNLCGVFIAAKSDAPLYLDTAGTVVASVIGGYLPGIAVSFITGLIKAILNSVDMYYGVLSIFTAVIAAGAARRGWFKGLVKPLAVIPVTAVITGVISSVLTWFLNARSIGGIGRFMAEKLVDKHSMGGFTAQLITDLLIGLADKAIMIAIAAVILKLLPKKVRNAFKDMSRWQAPLSEEMKKAVRKSSCRSLSLRTRLLIILSTAAILVAGVAISISYVLFKNSTIEEHTKLANGLTEMAVNTIDADKVNDYLKNGEGEPGYRETEQKLYKLRDSSPDIEYVYVYQIQEDGCHVVFDLDTDDLEGSPVGDIIEFDPSFEKYIPDLLAGKEIEPIISDGSYGWLLTVYKPVYDSNGNCVCYAAADVSMNLLNTYGYSFVAKLISLLVIFFTVLLAVSLWIVEHNIIMPVNTMAYSAGAFAYNSDEAREKSVERIAELDICTGDEIENLYLAFVKMSQDSMEYVDDIQHKTETISKMQNGLILTLADLVESRDKCTGDHVRKTAAYVKLIFEEMKEKGIYKEEVTDELIENALNAAPLHDVGKIHVSDAILNKPGKLTDEEFEIMKTHTTKGSEIIDRAMETVSDTGYLRESKNMSEYHHEKWNGKGYPHGISGEEIPLSARVMAVADVFDALVSERSYKKPFTIEQALDIIRKDAGTHFDPVVAQVFLEAQDKVREIALDHIKGRKD